MIYMENYKRQKKERRLGQKRMAYIRKTWCKEQSCLETEEMDKEKRNVLMNTWDYSRDYGIGDQWLWGMNLGTSQESKEGNRVLTGKEVSKLLMKDHARERGPGGADPSLFSIKKIKMKTGEKMIIFKLGQIWLSFVSMRWSLLSHVRLFATPWTVAYQALPSKGFSRQEYWSGLPFPSPEDLPDPGIEPMSPAL